MPVFAVKRCSASASLMSGPIFHGEEPDLARAAGGCGFAIFR